MFTLDQITKAHSKVKSGADFPAYIKDLRALGVIWYETSVTDGHTDYFGHDNFRTSTMAKYDLMPVAETANAGEFKTALKAHQMGQTDYPTFCADCAHWGIYKWVVRILEMNCTYYDKAGNEILVEQIPD